MDKKIQNSKFGLFDKRGRESGFSGFSQMYMQTLHASVEQKIVLQIRSEGQGGGEGGGGGLINEFSLFAKFKKVKIILGRKLWNFSTFCYIFSFDYFRYWTRNWGTKTTSKWRRPYKWRGIIKEDNFKIPNAKAWKIRTTQKMKSIGTK